MAQAFLPPLEGWLLKPSVHRISCNLNNILFQIAALCKV